jgi:hypothetical protein
MEGPLHERVVDQDHVVAALSNAVRISSAGLSNPILPAASFLFLGLSGVGKATGKSFCVLSHLSSQSIDRDGQRIPRWAKNWPHFCSMMSAVD